MRGGLAGFKPQELANTMWAYATADYYHQALLADCSRVISDSLARDPSRWSEEDRSQLHQWQLWLSLERGADAQQHLLSVSQRKLCCDAMQGTLVTISRLQRSVAIALAAVPHGFEEEHLEPRTGYSLDLALAALFTRRGRGGRPLSLPAARRPGRAQTQWANDAQAAPPRGGCLGGDQRSILRMGWLRDGQ